MARLPRLLRGINQVSYPNRTWCGVLEELRECYKTHNYAPMLGLLEELQIFGNRMESALYDGKDIRRINEEKHELLKELKQLKKLQPKAGKKKRKTRSFSLD